MSERGVTDKAGQAGPVLPTLRPDRGAVDVLVVGAFSCDVVFSGLPGLPDPGDEVWAESCSIIPGGTYITAAALHRLGVSTAWACRFGRDPFSQFVLEVTGQEGMDPAAFVEVDGPLPNISITLSHDGDRSFVSYAEPAAPIDLTAIRDLRPRLIVQPGLGEPDDLARLIEAARDVGAAVFVDPQSSRHTLASEQVRALIGQVDIFAPNEREALHLTGQDTVDAALHVLLESTAFTIIKIGARGAIAADRRSVVRLPALPIDAVETTGAGDCFNAGFIMAMLEHSTVVTCLQAGNAAGGLSTLAPSSTGIPTRAEVNRARVAYGSG